jgi:hypothetical protein
MLLSSLAAVCRRQLSAAIWRPSKGLAEVVLRKGKVLENMGALLTAAF